mgnify:CR=1 FL=1
MPPHLNTAFYQQHAINLCYSYQQLLNKPLIQMSHKGTLINQLFNAPFALLSHGLEDDPIFNFGNQGFKFIITFFTLIT